MNKKQLKEIEKETDLGTIANDSSKRDKHLSWGVIIDVSEPFRYENKDEYVVKIKIVDPTFNMKAYIENEEIKFHKFVTVHVYSGFINKCPKIKNVGDIIRLRRFNVSIILSHILSKFEFFVGFWRTLLLIQIDFDLKRF